MMPLVMFALSVGVAVAITFGVASARKRSKRACGRRDAWL
jgi:ABC-type dipeptide/oligopeptide/nickel transport system permease component